MERTPRPKGTTEIGHIYNKDKTNENLQLLHSHIIDHYINTGFMYCQQGMNVEEISEYTDIKGEYILDKITNRGKDIYGQIDPKEQGDHLRALLGITLENALTDRSRALKQYSILAASQGNGYKAFISSEVNKALKLTMESTQGILQIAKSLGGNQGLQQIVINNQQNNNEAHQHNYLTPEKAIELLGKQEDNKALIEDPKAKQDLYLKHDIGAMPIVKANQQQGLDTSKEGLNFNKMVELSDSKVDLMDETHIDRRARMEDVDLDSDQV